MAGQGLDRIPLRIPERWDAKWFETFVRDVLSQADVRNAVEGGGISITGQSDELATIAASADVLELLEAGLLTAEASSLENARLLVAGPGITFDDEGPGETLTVSTTWYDIPGVPIYVESPSSPAWDFRLDGDIVGFVGIANGADGIATGSLDGDLVLFPSAGLSLPPVLGRVFIPGTSAHAGAAAFGQITAPERQIHLGGPTGAVIRFDDTNEVADGKVWLIVANGAVFTLLTRTDIDGSGATAIQVTRSATAVTEIELNATTFDLNGALDVSGTGIFAGATVTITNAGAALRLDQSNAGADMRNTLLRSAGPGFRISSATDAAPTTPVNDLFNGARSGTTWSTLAITTGTEIELNSTLLDVNAAVEISGILNLESTINRVTNTGGPLWRFIDSDSASNEKVWEIRNNAGVFSLTARDDAEANPVNAFFIDRTGLAIDEIEFNATLFDLNGALDLSGNATFNAQVTVLSENGLWITAANAANFYLTDSDAAADTKLWRQFVQGTTWSLVTRTDANGAGNTAIIIGRTGTTVDTITASATTIQLNATTLDFNGTLDVDGGNHDISTTGTFTISGTGETLATFADDGACIFYHDNTARIQTTNVGAQINGSLTVGAITASGVADGLLWMGSYNPGSFTVQGGRYALIVKRLALTSNTRATLQTSSRLKVI